MLELEEALKRILETIVPAKAEAVPLAKAYGRILAETVLSPLDLPPFDNSAMDGYAVRSVDLGCASADTPVRLRIIGRVAAGERFAGELTTGTCVRLFTGSPLPSGADVVVMQEDTLSDASRPDEVLVQEPVKPWENVRFCGEDLRRGAVLAKSGETITAGRASLMGATGLAEVRVGGRPQVGLLATGSELREAGQPLGPGQIYESNRLGLATLVSRAGGRAKIFPLVPDERIATNRALATAFQECEIVVTSGGVSVGEMDLVKAEFAELGGELQFWKVAIKPGRPFVFGRLRDRFLFGLPGNPVSAFVTFLLLVHPALRRWQGATDVSLPAHPGTLAEPLSNPGQRRHFVRVQVDPAGMVHSSGTQASHILSSLAAADGLVEVAPGSALPAGATVRVIHWE